MGEGNSPEQLSTQEQDVLNADKDLSSLRESMALLGQLDSKRLTNTQLNQALSKGFSTKK